MSETTTPASDLRDARDGSEVPAQCTYCGSPHHSLRDCTSPMPAPPESLHSGVFDIQACVGCRVLARNGFADDVVQANHDRCAPAVVAPPDKRDVIDRLAAMGRKSAEAMRDDTAKHVAPPDSDRAAEHSTLSFADPAVSIEQKVHWLIGSVTEFELENEDKTRATFYRGQAEARERALVAYVKQLESLALISRAAVVGSERRADSEPTGERSS